MKTIEHLHSLLEKKKLKIAFIEGATGGSLISDFTLYDGASKSLAGGIVAYSKNVKTNILGVDPNLVNKYGEISQEVSNEMAIKGMAIFNADIVISTVGNIGSNPIEDKMIGLVYSTILLDLKSLKYKIISDKKSREKMRSYVSDYIFKEVVKLLSEKNS